VRTADEVNQATITGNDVETRIVAAMREAGG
jgi:hypothetical protein